MKQGWLPNQVDLLDPLDHNLMTLNRIMSLQPSHQMYFGQVAQVKSRTYAMHFLRKECHLSGQINGRGNVLINISLGRINDTP